MLVGVFSTTSASYNHRKPRILYLEWLLELALVICPFILVKKFPLWRILRNFRLHMRRTYFRTGHVTDVTSGHVTSGHVTSGSTTAQHHRKYDFVAVLIGSMFCAYPAFSRVFFLVLVPWLPDVTKCHLTPFGVLFVCVCATGSCATPIVVNNVGWGVLYDVRVL
jgi:hypothetical protein